MPRGPNTASARYPFVFLNVATTADGKIAPAHGRYLPFGSKRDHQLLLELRSRADAVMAGARTIDSYKVTMGPGGPSFRRKRIRNGLSEYNLRIVVSGLASVNPCAEIFKHRFSPIVLITTAKAPLSRRTACRAAGAEIEICGESEIDFEMAMRRLRQRWGVRHLLCEGGGQLNQALLTAGLVNEIHQTICPLLLGGRAAPTLADGAGISNLKEAVQLRLKSWRRCHDELFLVHAVQPRVTPASVSAVATT